MRGGGGMKPRGRRGVVGRMPDDDCLPLRLGPWLARHDDPPEPEEGEAAEPGDDAPTG